MLFDQPIPQNDYALTKTLAEGGLVKVYGPTVGDRKIFRRDHETFQKHKNLRCFVRDTWPDEFEPMPLHDARPRQPTLWVLVIRIHAEFHIVVPIWRGRPFFDTTTPGGFMARADVEGDAAIAAILHECTQRGGSVAEEVQKFYEASEAYFR